MNGQQMMLFPDYGQFRRHIALEAGPSIPEKDEGLPGATLSGEPLEEPSSKAGEDSSEQLPR